jgi:sulfide dehydrogenase [flavocytochrome c] flavoprotein chain
MVDLNRRQFIKVLGGTSLFASLGFPTTTLAQGSSVVVIGGGFGGATCAKYIRRYGPGIGVTLIEPNEKYITCPFSNTVLSGINTMDFITQDYNILHKKHGVSVIHDMATAIDPVGKKVTLNGGKLLSFDRLVVSPGIDFRWDQIEGYHEAASEIMPHAWKAGPQTMLLRKQLEAMPDGGVVIIATPEGPMRAPGAPYERASMIAQYLNDSKPKSKVLILDSNDSFEEHDLFIQAWKKLYPDMIEWVNNSQVVKVNAHEGVKTAYTKDGSIHKGDVINIIPPQKAGAIADSAGLTDASGWCPINPITFESSNHKNIHVIGDACIAGEMPKAGSSANTQAKVCAAAIVSSLMGDSMPESTLISVFYSVIGNKYAISTVGVYQANDGQIKQVSGGTSPKKASKKDRRKEVKYAKGWYKGITWDTFR